MKHALLLLALLLPQETDAAVSKLVRELEAAPLDRRDDVVAKLVKLGKPAAAAIRKEHDATRDVNLKGLLAGALEEIDAAPLRQVRIVTLRGDQLILVDVPTAKETVLAKGVNHYQFHPKDRTKLLVHHVEDLAVVDFTGKRTVVAHKQKIVHPGCGHVEPALNSARWIHGGDAIHYSYREIPAGKDPHEHSEDQFKDAIVKADGTGLVPLEVRFGLHSDSHNISLGDVSPDGTRAIASRVTKRIGDGAEVEVFEGLPGKKETTRIGTFELASLSYLGGFWSPDSSKWFFYHSHRVNNQSVYDLYLWDGKASTKVGEESRLGLGGTGGYCFVWSPDSSKIAWLPDRKQGKETLAVLDLKTMKTVRIDVEHASGPEIGKPAWTADGSKLVAVTHRCPMEKFHQHRFVGCKPVLTAFDPATGKATTLAEDGVADRATATSPDSAYIYFWRPAQQTPKGKGDVWDEWESQTFDLCAVNVQTGAVVPVTKSRLFPNLYRADIERK